MRPARRSERYSSLVRVDTINGRPADEVCPTELAVVAWAANLGTLRFHPWPVTSADVDHPDQLRIDLDPQPGTDFSHAAAVAPTLPSRTTHRTSHGARSLVCCQ